MLSADATVPTAWCKLKKPSVRPLLRAISRNCMISRRQPAAARSCVTGSAAKRSGLGGRTSHPRPAILWPVGGRSVAGRWPLRLATCPNLPPCCAGVFHPISAIAAQDHPARTIQRPVGRTHAPESSPTTGTHEELSSERAVLTNIVGHHACPYGASAPSLPPRALPSRHHLLPVPIP